MSGAGAHLDECDVQVGGCDLAELGVQPAAAGAPGREEVHHHEAVTRLALQQRAVVLLPCGHRAHVVGREVRPPARVCIHWMSTALKGLQIISHRISEHKRFHAAQTHAAENQEDEPSVTQSGRAEATTVQGDSRTRTTPGRQPAAPVNPAIATASCKTERAARCRSIWMVKAEAAALYGPTS